MAAPASARGRRPAAPGMLGDIRRSRTGMAGAAVLAALVALSAAALVAVPAETLRDWNNPDKWLSLPRSAVPAWVNWLAAERIPEHLVLDGPASAASAGGGGGGGMTASAHTIEFEYDYDGFPDDFIYEYEAAYSAPPPLLELRVERPDGIVLRLASEPLPAHPSAGGGAPQPHSGRIFSADASVRKSIEVQRGAFAFDVRGVPAEAAVFSRPESPGVLAGTYAFTAVLYGAGPGGDAAHSPPSLESSRLIVGGKAFGAMGTDALRRDLAAGLVWGTPLALFIGVAVAAGSVAMGLSYGAYAGYRGRLTDEAMMRANDVVYALPALPFLIILAVTISSSIFVMIGFLMLFGWVGVAKVARSMALQIRAAGFVEASRMMGQTDARVMLRHVIPQMLPYAFASVAISVPAAITTEAGLSFLGLGDPTFPTWGQMLHDASEHGAAAQGMWWWIVPPGMMIAATGLAFVLIGSALDAAVNPRLRQGGGGGRA